MAAPTMTITKKDHARFTKLLKKIAKQTNAKFVFLVDRAGQHIASAGELEEVDPTSLASLTAGNVAATEGVAQLVGEKEFTTLFHEGVKDSLHFTVVGKTILLVVFDERSSLGLVRLRVEQMGPELGAALADVIARPAKKSAYNAEAESLGEITEEDVDALFGQ